MVTKLSGMTGEVFFRHVLVLRQVRMESVHKTLDDAADTHEDARLWQYIHVEPKDVSKWPSMIF